METPERDFAVQAAALRMQNLDRGMEEFDFRLQHSALTVAATVGSLAALFSDTQYGSFLFLPFSLLFIFLMSLWSTTVHAATSDKKLLKVVCRVTEALLTQMAAAIFQALTLASQLKQMLLDFLCRLKFSSSAVTKKTMRMLNHGACQVKVHQLLRS